MPWGIARTGADSNSNEGADVYFLGTFLNSDHADLASNIGALDNGQDVVGMAAQVTLHTAKICNSRGLRPNSGTATAALDWVTSEVTARGEAAAVNMSIGGNGSVTGTGTFTNNGFVGNDSYHEAICNARNAGVVVAAGNSSDNACWLF
jgi:subtilisin